MQQESEKMTYEKIDADRMNDWIEIIEDKWREALLSSLKLLTNYEPLIEETEDFNEWLIVYYSMIDKYWELAEKAMSGYALGADA